MTKAPVSRETLERSFLCVQACEGISDEDLKAGIVGDVVSMLASGEDIISGLEAEADNTGIDLAEARAWWTKASELLSRVPGRKEN